MTKEYDEFKKKIRAKLTDRIGQPTASPRRLRIPNVILRRKKVG